MADPSPMEVPPTKATGLKGRKLLFSSPATADKIKPKKPLTRATSSKQEVHEKEYVERVSTQRKGKPTTVEVPIEIVDITTPQENPTFKIFKIQLKEARAEVEEMKEKDFVSRKELSEILKMHHENIDKANLLAKRFLPLHRKLINLYRQNIAYQTQIRRLKMELQPFKEEMAKRNMDMLAKVATKKSSRVRI
jgi:hypothetical protein